MSPCLLPDADGLKEGFGVALDFGDTDARNVQRFLGADGLVAG
jgi:hypothetical protein